MFSSPWLQRILIGVGLLGTIGVGSVEAATYYVATNGNNSWDGLAPTFEGGSRGPKRQPWAATNLLRAGDTLFLRNGRYEGFDTSAKGTAQAPVRIKSYPGEWAIIDAALAPGSVTVTIYGGVHLIVEDLEITDSRTSEMSNVRSKTFPMRIYCEGWTQATGCGYTGTKGPTTLRNLHIHHGRGTAILSYQDNLTIEKCKIYANGRRWSDNTALGVEAYATYLLGYNNIVRDNLIYDNSGNGIRVGNTDTYPFVNGIIENNIIYNNRAWYTHSSGWSGDGGNGIVLYGAWYNIVRNNVIYGAHDRPIHVWDGDNTIVNNTISWSQTSGSVDASYIAAPRTRLHNNIFINHTVILQGSGATVTHNIISNLSHGSGNTVNNNITTRPTFVQTTGALATHNYRLAAGSAGIDVGMNASQWVTRDLEGNVRPRGNGWDLGAYEFAGGSSISAPMGLKVN